MQFTDWPLVEVALLLIGLTHLSFLTLKPACSSPLKTEALSRSWSGRYVQADTYTNNTVCIVPHRPCSLSSTKIFHLQESKISVYWLKSDTRHATVFSYKDIEAPDLSEKVEAVSSMLKKYSMNSLLEAVLSSFPAIPFTKPTLLKK